MNLNLWIISAAKVEQIHKGESLALVLSQQEFEGVFFNLAFEET